MKRDYSGIKLVNGGSRLADIAKYSLVDGIAMLTMDYGKVNAVTPAMSATLNDSHDRATRDALMSESGYFRTSPPQRSMPTLCRKTDNPESNADGDKRRERDLTRDHNGACNSLDIDVGVSYDVFGPGLHTGVVRVESTSKS